MIKFTKVNEVYSKISCDQDVLYELIDEYSKFVPNYEYTPLFKAGQWDGKIRFISRYGQFYSGLLKDIWKSCQAKGATLDEFKFEGYTKTSTYTEESILERLQAFKLPFDFYDYQVEAIVECLTKKRRIIESSTGSGKSLIIYAVTRILAEDGHKILIQVPSVMLVNQMISDFNDYAALDTFNIDENVHKIYAGQDKVSDKGVYVSTWQSIAALAIKTKGVKKVDKSKQMEFMEQFDVCMSDEVHKSDATVVRGIMELSINAPYKFGFTGTLNEDDKALPELLIGLYGNPHRVSSTKELMDSGRVSKLKIYPMILKYPTDIRRLVSKMEYKDELTTLIGYTARNEFIAKLAGKLNGNTIILLRHIDKHAKPLKELLERYTNKTVILLDKDTKNDIREEVRKSLETIDDAIIIGTYSLISTGVSIKNLKYLIFAAPLKSRIAVLQAIGRILRLSKNKDLATLFDLVDDMEYKGKSNYSLDHFRTRFEYYAKEEFDVELKEFTLD